MTVFTGKVAAAGELLVSALGQRPCVYWDVRDGLDDAPRRVGKSDFWLEDAEGRVLVVSEHLRVELRAERAKQLVAVAEADLAELSARLRELKALLRTEQGAAASKLRKERAHLAKVATFLHATRAHARGKVHVGGTARGQERWLREHGRGASGGPGESTAMLLSEAWEVVIEVGQRVTLEGECSIEAVAPELLPSQGYRTRATARVLRGSAASPLVLIGTGDRAPRAAAAKPVVRAQELSRATRHRLALALALAVAIVAFALFAAR
ncbi:MAG: hypothetical protein AMXMBFR56_43900 [Polyangiaceae bacterium]